MVFGKGFKHIVKGYSKTILSSRGTLTQSIKDRINAGDERTIREVLNERKAELVNEANEEVDPIKKQEINSQTDSVQEVIDNLNAVLNA